MDTAQRPHPHTTARRRRAGGERRQLALEAATEVLAERGYDQTRFKDVADRCGLAVSTLQFYFGSRDDMLVEALRTATEQEVARLEKLASDAENPWEGLVRLVDCGIDTPAATWRTLMELWNTAYRDEEIRAHSLWLIDAYRAPFLSAVTEGRDSGSFAFDDEPADVVTVLLATIDGLLHPTVLGHESVDRPEVRAVMLRMARQLVGLVEG